MFGIDKLVKRVCDRLDEVAGTFAQEAEKHHFSDPLSTKFDSIATTLKIVAQVIREENEK